MQSLGGPLSIADAWTNYDDIESRLTVSVSERMLDVAELLARSVEIDEQLQRMP